MQSQWLMRIEGALSASFIQSDGSKKPGVDWSVGLKYGDKIYRVMVRAYLMDNVSAATRADQQYQGQTVMGYLNDLIQQGWTPDQPRTHVIHIGDPK